MSLRVAHANSICVASASHRCRSPRAKRGQCFLGDGHAAACGRSEGATSSRRVDGAWCPWEQTGSSARGASPGIWHRGARGDAVVSRSAVADLAHCLLEGLASPDAVIPANGYALAIYTLLVSASFAKPARRVVRRASVELLLLPLAMLYLILLCKSWRPDTAQILFPGSLKAGLEGGFNPQFFPRLAGIVDLFSRCQITTSSLWLHLLSCNLFAAVCICKDGIKRRILTAHSVALCVASAVVGLASHHLTAALATSSDRDTRRDDGSTVFTF